MVDTYTITYTNGNTTTFTVTNGEDSNIPTSDYEALKARVAELEENELTNEPTLATSLHITDSANAKFRRFLPEGHSEQETTEGYNLAPLNYPNKTKGSLTITNNGDGSLTFSGTTSNSINDIITTTFTLVAGTYTFYANKTAGTTLYGNLSIIKASDSSIVKSMNFNYSKVTFTISEEIDVKMQYYIPSNQATNITIYPMVYSGTETKDFEKYTNGASPNPDYEQPIKSAGDNGSINEKITNADGTEEQTYSVYTQQPFRSIGDVRDCFVKKSDGWYERHYIGRKIFDGTGYWTFSADQGGHSRFDFRIADAVLGSITNNPIQSNRFRTNFAVEDNSIFLSGVEPMISIICDEFRTLDGFKTMLAEKYANGNPVYADYLRKTPLDLPCTEEQIQQLENRPYTYKTETNVLSEDEVEAYVDAEYVIDLKTYIDNN